MTNYAPQTSASKRYEAARKIIAAHDAAVDAYADATDLDEAYAAEARMEDATSDAVGILRALITPPRVGESEEQIAERVLLAHSGTDIRSIVTAAVRAGIQSAHETWEPADVPSQEQMLRWLGLDCFDSTDDEGEPSIFIRPQHIEREV